SHRDAAAGRAGPQGIPGQSGAGSHPAGAGRGRRCGGACRRAPAHPPHHAGGKDAQVRHEPTRRRRLKSCRRPAKAALHTTSIGTAYVARTTSLLSAGRGCGRAPDRRVVNASRWPPGGASVHTALGGRKDADRPTPAPPLEGGQRPRWPPGGAAVATPSAAREAPTARDPPRPSEGGHGAALATGRGCGAHRIGGREGADRPTPAPPLVGWSTPRVGHRAGLRCPPYRRPEKRRPPYTRAALVGWSTLRVGHRAGLRYTALGGRKDADRPPPRTRTRRRAEGAERCAGATGQGCG